MENDSSILVTGPVSSGKTFMTVGIANDLINNHSINHNKVNIIVNNPIDYNFWINTMHGATVYNVQQHNTSDMISSILENISESISPNNNGYYTSLLIMDTCPSSNDTYALNIITNPQLNGTYGGRYFITTTQFPGLFNLNHLSIFNRYYILKYNNENINHIIYNTFINPNQLSYVVFNNLYSAATVNPYTALIVRGYITDHQQYLPYSGIPDNTVTTIMSSVNSLHNITNTMNNIFPTNYFTVQEVSTLYSPITDNSDYCDNINDPNNEHNMDENSIGGTSTLLSINNDINWSMSSLSPTIHPHNQNINNVFPIVSTDTEPLLSKWNNVSKKPVLFSGPILNTNNPIFKPKLQPLNILGKNLLNTGLFGTMDLRPVKKRRLAQSLGETNEISRINTELSIKDLRAVKGKITIIL